MKIDTYLQPQDLVGCRFRLRQKQTYPAISATETAKLRKLRLDKAREHVFKLFPTSSQLGDNKDFLRIDINDADDLDTRWFYTLEAIATQATLITNPVVEALGYFQFPIDALVRRPEGTYMPVLVTNHRAARNDPNRSIQVIPTRRLGLTTAEKAKYRMKHHAVDSYTLALADRFLCDLGCASSRGVLIGQNHELAFVLDTSYFQQGLQAALETPIPSTPHRVKECSHCRYWSLCEKELINRNDISLLFPGDKALQLQRSGIDSVEKLADSGSGDDAVLARAYLTGVEFIRRRKVVSAPRFDIEIDIDVEAYLDQGAYLWGTYDGQNYRPFVTWNELGGKHEAANFAQFWQWLTDTRTKAKAEGKSIGVFCYSAHGENHWLRGSALRFHGHYPGVPSEAEVMSFIASNEWIDVFALVKQQLMGTKGLGLKAIAPLAGHHWEEQELDGEASVNLYLVATGAVLRGDVLINTSLIDAQQALLSYNGDDCRATAAVRAFLSHGAPGVPYYEQGTPVE